MDELCFGEAEFIHSVAKSSLTDGGEFTSYC